MRQVTRKGLITIAAAGGVLALSGGGAAFADATASGGAENSPGVASGNSVQVPVHVPVNLCGNTVDAAGLLNPAFGNTCVNDGGSDSRHEKQGTDGEQSPQGGEEATPHQGDEAAPHQGGGSGGSTAEGVAKGSPGVASGNQVQVPVEVPVNACGNSVNIIGLLNPTFGNECVNDSGSDWEPPVQTPDEPEKDDTPSTPETQTVPHTELAQTGAGYELETALGMGASLVLGGTILYRRARAAQR